MASPPVMRVLSVPASRSIRTAPPSLPTTAVSRASFAPVTVRSAETTTWLVTGSTTQAVPGMLTECSRSAVVRASSAQLRVTSRGTAPAARTDLAASVSVTVTTSFAPS
jgi:hypothetical protein